MNKIQIINYCFIVAFAMNRCFSMSSQAEIQYFDATIEKELFNECEELVKVGNSLPNPDQNSALQIFSNLRLDILKWGGIDFLLHTKDYEHVSDVDDILKLKELKNNSIKYEEYKNIVKKMQEIIEERTKIDSLQRNFKQAKQKTKEAQRSWDKFIKNDKQLAQNYGDALALGLTLPNCENHQQLLQETQAKSLQAYESWQTAKTVYVAYIHARLLPFQLDVDINDKEKFMKVHATPDPKKDSVIFKSLLLLKYDYQQLQKNSVK